MRTLSVTMKTSMRILSVPALALALAGPVRADSIPCDGMLSCAAMIPVATAYAGFLYLKPAPTLIHALKAVDGNDNAGLKRLMESHPELVRLTPDQSALLAEMEAGADRYRAQDAVVLVRSKEFSYAKEVIESRISERDWRDLEWQLKMHPDLAAAVDGGYVLLKEAARMANLEAVRMLLDAGVRADTHQSGALPATRNDDVRQLLASRGAATPQRGNAKTAASADCPAGTAEQKPAN